MFKIYGKLLIDEYPILVLPKLAEEVGLNEAIFLQQLHYWLKGKSAKKRDDNTWIFNTYKDWELQFPFWSNATIRRVISSCEESKLITTTSKYNKKGYDKTKWYSINYEELNRLLNMSKGVAQSEQSTCSKRANGSAHNEQTYTRDYPETTTETKKKSPQSEKRYGDDSPYIKLAHHLFNYIKQRNPEHKKPNWQTWADDFRKAAELDKRSIDNLKEIIDWSQQNNFWQNNILSAAKLRKQYDKLKIQMNENNNIRKPKGAYTTDEYDDWF